MIPTKITALNQSLETTPSQQDFGDVPLHETTSSSTPMSTNPMCFSSIPTVTDGGRAEATQSKSKKQKISPNLNKNPGEKRTLKHFWAKIDTPKPKTPANKSAKSKPKSKKIDKNVNGNSLKQDVVECFDVAEHVPVETLVKSSCRNSLKFSENPEFCLDDARVSEDIVSNDSTTVVDCKHEQQNIKPQSISVYSRRRLKGKCLPESRRLGPNFEQSCKKKRSKRKSISVKALKRFDTFEYSSDSLERLLIMKGRSRRLVSAMVKTSQDLCREHSPLMSLLSFPSILPKKKRSARKKKCQFALEDEQNNLLTHSPPSTVTSLSEREDKDSLLSSEVIREDIVKTPQKPIDYESTVGEAQVVALCPFTPNPSQEGKRSNSKKPCNKAIKQKVCKEKKPKLNSKRTGKKGKKEEDSLANFTEWDDDIAVEKVVEDHIIKKLASLSVRENPKDWSIVVSFQDNNQGNEDINVDKINLEAERTTLCRYLTRFVKIVEALQGNKKFVKWNGSVLDSVVGVYLTQNVSDVLSSDAYMHLASRYPIDRKCLNDNEANQENVDINIKKTSSTSIICIVELPDEDEDEDQGDDGEEASVDHVEEAPMDENKEYDDALKEMLAAMPSLQDKGKGKADQEGPKIDWEVVRKMLSKNNTQRTPETQDSVDWEAVRKAPVHLIANLIRCRGQHNIIAAKIQQTLNRLVEDHDSLDLEWLRDAPPEVAKAYLLNFYGLGLKSVDCLRLLTLKHHGFPVDVNIARIAIRLGWVPIKPLPSGLWFHQLEKYPLEADIQRYLWPRLCHLPQEELYHLHYQMITFGKLFCHKRSPNCGACPFQGECKYYASLKESNKLALEWKSGNKSKKWKKNGQKPPNVFDYVHLRLAAKSTTSQTCTKSPPCLNPCSSSLTNGSSSQLLLTSNDVFTKPEYFVEEPSSPEPQVDEEFLLEDVEDFGYHLSLTKKEEQRSPKHYEESYMPSQCSESKAIVRLSPDAAFNFLPKHKLASRLRTEHLVYVLPRNHPLLRHLHLDAQMGDEPYLLAIWLSDQVENTDSSEDHSGCTDDAEASTSRPNNSTVPGTILIPPRTALHDKFPLNGTYFQPNEVFADYETSEQPVDVPRNWIWGLDRRILYCGSSASSIATGFTQVDVQRFSLLGFICVRGFDRQSRDKVALPKRFNDRLRGKEKVAQG